MNRKGVRLVAVKLRRHHGGLGAVGATGRSFIIFFVVVAAVEVGRTLVFVGAVMLTNVSMPRELKRAGRAMSVASEMMTQGGGGINVPSGTSE